MSFKNTTTALENMIIARDVLASRGVPLFLIFGTLLGAIREHDFIAHDHDVDTGIFERDEAKLLEALPAMASQGLVVGSIWSNKRCYSLVRGEEQIDIFITREQPGLFGRRWNLDGKASIPARYLDSLDETLFRGQSFKTPHEPVGVLLNLYGRTWNIPIDGKVSRIDVSARVRTALRSPLKTIAYVPTFVGNRITWALHARKTARSNREAQK